MLAVMRRIYLALAGLQLLAVLLQFYFAAVGAFAHPQNDSSYALHGIEGTIVIPAVSVLATVAAALARVPRRLVALTIAPLGLVVVQVLIIVVGYALTGSTEDRTTPAGLAVLGLHALGGLATLAVAGLVFNRARAAVPAA
jgi:hypothetical protein